MITKKDYLIRYGTYWGDLLLRVFAPIGITAWQFGFFKTNSSFFGQIQGTVIIATIIALWQLKDEAQETLSELENQGWYEAIKRSLVLGLIFVILLFARNFFDEMLWVVGSFFLGSLPSNVLSGVHTKYKNKIKVYKKKQKEKEGI